MESIKELWSKDNLSNYRDILVKQGPLAFYVQFVQDYINNNGIELVEPKPIKQKEIEYGTCKNRKRNYR